jgi:hypothetical protein
MDLGATTRRFTRSSGALIGAILCGSLGVTGLFVALVINPFGFFDGPEPLVAIGLLALLAAAIVLLREWRRDAGALLEICERGFRFRRRAVDVQLRFEDVKTLAPVRWNGRLVRCVVRSQTQETIISGVQPLDAAVRELSQRCRAAPREA